MILSNKEALEIIAHNNVFIVKSDGGMGNKFGSFFSAIEIYVKNKLYESHKFMCISCAKYWCELKELEIFEANDNLIFVDDAYPPVLDQFFLLPFNEPLVSEVDKLRKHIMYLGNCLHSSTDGLHYFDINIKPSLREVVTSFIDEHNISQKHTLGVHIRSTDAPLHLTCKQDELISKVDVNYSRYKNVFVCSDDLTIQTELTKKWNGIEHPYLHPVTKLPGCDHLPWILDEPHTEEVFLKLNIKAHYNVCRSRDHCLEALKDLLVLAHCDLSLCAGMYTTYLQLGVFLVQHFFDKRMHQHNSNTTDPSIDKNTSVTQQRKTPVSHPIRPIQFNDVKPRHRPLLKMQMVYKHDK